MRIARKLYCSLWSIQQLMIAAPLETIQLFFLVMLQGIAPGASLILIGKIVNWIEAAGSSSLYFLPLGLIALWGGILCLESIASPFISIARIHLNEKVLTHCNILLMQKANSFETLAPFEDPVLYDQIQFLREEAKRKPLNFVYIVVGFFKDIATLSSIIFALSTFNTILPVFIILAAIPHAFSTMLLEKQSWDQMLFRSPEARKMAWLSGLTLDEKAGKEIRLFGFGEHLVNRYRELARAFHNVLGNHRPKEMLRSTLLSLLTVLSNLSIFTWMLLESQHGLLGTGALIVAFQAFIVVQMQTSSLMQNVAMLIPVLSFFEKLKTFLAEDQYLKSGQSIGVPIESIRIGIVFENVSFSYPGGREALKEINLHIGVGEKIALVGENGAGKTTLVKLLARLYDPTEGRILVDGIDLKEIEVQSWRRLLSAVFQDFGQYHFTARENIALGGGERGQNEGLLELAAVKGGFSQVASRLPQGIDTLLGKEFGGTSLSGGEWQKLAMSRAFMRDASVLILDEPTAALDPKSEYDVFQKFSANIEGRTAILITHRLGSVKMADRIIVLKNGRLVEEGSHSSLLEQGREYAEMFSMQADLYQISSEPCAVAEADSALV